MKINFSIIIFLFLCLMSGPVNAIGQSFPVYEEVETYDDLYASIDADGIKVYTNAPQTESIVTFYIDEEYDYLYTDEVVAVAPMVPKYEFSPYVVPMTTVIPIVNVVPVATVMPTVNVVPVATVMPTANVVTAVETVAAEPVKSKGEAKDDITDLASIYALIEKHAEENNLDPALIRSIIDQESKFNHRAVSRAGARGLMQLMPATARSLGVRNSFDPEENIRAGVRHFRALMNRFNDDLDLSLAAYNAGESIVSRLGRIPDYRETREYVASVKRKYESMENSAAETVRQVQPQPIMRYTDESGIIHLTNIRTFN